MLTNKEFLILKKGKTVVCLFLFLLCFFVFIVYANVVRNIAFRISVSFVNTEPKNLVLCDYKVFGTKNSFNKNLLAYIEEEKNFLKSKDEFTVVKIKGEYSVNRKADYILISEESVPELNVEIYVAKNFDFNNNSLPLKTVVILLQKIIKIVIYILFTIAFLVCFFSFSKYCVIKKTNRVALSIKSFQKG